MAKAVLPRVQALVLCDDIVPSPDEDGVFNLRGVRTRIGANCFPYTHPCLYVYLQVSGHEGAASCRIVVLDPKTDETLAVTPEHEIRLRGPLDIVSTPLVVEDCTFPEAGVYWVQVYFGDRLSGERPLDVAEDGS